MERLMIVDRNLRDVKGLSLDELRDADTVIGKGNVVLKNRQGHTGQKLSDRDVERLKARHVEVRVRGGHIGYYSDDNPDE